MEREVERLLEVDATAEDVQYGKKLCYQVWMNDSKYYTEVFDNREMEMESDAATQDIDIDSESESDEDLAAAIDRDLEELEEEDREDDNEDEDEDEDESDEDEDEDETGNTGEIGKLSWIGIHDGFINLIWMIEQKKQEIAEIKQAIQRKTADLLTAPNAMLKVINAFIIWYGSINILTLYSYRNASKALWRRSRRNWHSKKLI